jgi:hypothetical protein
VSSIEILFSDAGSDADGSSGLSNGAGDCHLIYYFDTNTVHLDNSSGPQNVPWTSVASSTIGSGGNVLQKTGACTIYAGSSSTVPIQDGQFAAGVKLDVEFTSIAKKHVYVFTTNKNGNHSYGSSPAPSPVLWSYWGWWKPQ